MSEYSFQMESSKTYQPTPEQIERWKHIDELEHGVTAGFITQEQENINVENFFATDYIDSQLERLSAHKKKLVEKLKSAEEYEKLLLKEKQKRSNK